MQGVYLITNTVNGTRYVGSAQDIAKRWKQHKREQHNPHLKNAIQRYGIEAFAFEILEEVQDDALLLQSEQFWLDVHNCRYALYNILRIAGSCLGRKHTAETKKKLSEANKGKSPPNKGAAMGAEQKAKLRAAWTRRPPVPAAVRQKMAESLRGHEVSAETRRKIGEANKGKRRPRN